jgi:hypothetical protein
MPIYSQKIIRDMEDLTWCHCFCSHLQLVWETVQISKHEVIFTPEDVVRVLDKVIYHLETPNITTVRASILPIFAVCQKVVTAHMLVQLAEGCSSYSTKTVSLKLKSGRRICNFLQMEVNEKLCQETVYLIRLTVCNYVQIISWHK